MTADVLPDGWKEATLGDLGEFATSSVDKKLSSSETLVSLVNYMDVYQHEFIDSSLPLMQVTATKVEIDSSQVHTGDMLFTPSSETPDDIGHSAVVVEELPRTLHSYHTVRLRPWTAVELDTRFRGRLANTTSVLKHFAERATGSTRYTLSLDDFRSAPVRIPPFLEQRRIAEILETLDGATRRTEQVIAKLQRMKQGLIHDLLTRGIDEHGDLRDPELHPEQFKDSALRQIPREWEVRQCEDVCRRIEVGIVIRPSQYYASAGVPVLRSANVRENGIDLSNLKFMTERAHRAMPKSAVGPGDLVTVRTGYPGTSAVIPETLSTANCVDIIISRPGPDVRPHYLATWINSDQGKGQILRVQGGLAQQHFNVGELKKLLVALPSLAEQDRITVVHDQLEERLGREEMLFDKLRSLKHGLMDDLLTGRVRASVPDETTP